jgi:hypothetical protein
VHSFKHSYILASTSGDSILDSTFFISLMVCSASVRVRIYQGSAFCSSVKFHNGTYGMWEDSRKVRKVALVNSQNTFRLDRSI